MVAPLVKEAPARGQPLGENLLKLDLSVIVPLSETEVEWQLLCSYLAVLPQTCEVIFVRPTPLSCQERIFLSTVERRIDVRWVTSPKGRAIQMNHGASLACKENLWFLHADSRFSPGGLKALEQALTRKESALYYFNLAFRGDGPALAQLNAWGAWLRSHWFKLPFGDQGFCLPTQLFFQLGTYDEQAPYGEDHLLIWQAIKMRVPIRCTGATLSTSARKYQTQGWLKTTLNHHFLTWKQALPEGLDYFLKR